MFNSYGFSYNINAVHGTLRKSHPKSKIIVSKIQEDLRIFSKENPHIWINHFDERQVVVLQVMLCGENKALIEFVELKDFEMVGEDNYET